MNSRSPFLNKLRRRGCIKSDKEMSAGHIKDAIITQIQPFYNTDIVDLEIEGLADLVSVKIYTKKGGPKQN